MSRRAASPRPRKEKRHQVSRSCPWRVRQNLSFVNRPSSASSTGSRSVAASARAMRSALPTTSRWSPWPPSGSGWSR